jgi:carbon storage regulator CsrA
MSLVFLKRRREQGIQIGPDITITVVGIEAGAVVLGISAPSDLQITRTIRVMLDGQTNPEEDGLYSAQ